MRQRRTLTARRGLPLLLALSMLLITLAGCGGKEPDTTADQSDQPQIQTEEPAAASQEPTPEPDPEPEPEPEPDPVELALEQYRIVVGLTPAVRGGPAIRPSPSGSRVRTMFMCLNDDTRPYVGG